MPNSNNLCGTSGTIPLSTDRLLLRRFTLEDAGDMLRNWIADPEVQRNYGEPVYQTEQAVQALLEQWICRYEDAGFYRWAVIWKETNECVGQIAFCRVYPEIDTAEVEYCVGRAFQGRGIAAEALRAVMDYALGEAGFARVEAFHRAANPVSGRVLQKAGMLPAETVRRFELAGHKPEHEVCYRAEQII